MTTRPIFIRNARASRLYEYFFVSAVASILLIRTFLVLTDYPQLGSGGLHVAHMLYGGAFMLAALILCFSSLGHRAQSVAAFLGGVGFGFFIDELGKFLTRDNNYFFKPASVIIYLIFVGLFFIFRRFSRERVYTKLEYTINAIALLEEVILQDLDGSEHRKLQHYLKSADRSDPLVAELYRVVQSIPKSAVVEHRRLDRFRHQAGQHIARLLDLPKTQKLINIVLIGQAIFSIAILIVSIVHKYDFSGHMASAIPVHQVAQLSAAAISFTIIMIGAYRLRTDRGGALELFSRALLFDLLVTEPIIFYSEQFLAVFGLAFKLSLWTAILYLAASEDNETLHSRKKTAAATS